MITQSERDQFMGFHATPDVRAFIQMKARKEGVSMSFLINTMLKAMMEEMKEAELPGVKDGR